MTLVFRPRALADLIAIREYLLEHAGEDAADRVRRHLAKRLEALARRPALGIASSHPETRILNPTKYPYRIYVTTNGETVVVLHIRHTARNLPDPADL